MVLKKLTIDVNWVRVGEEQFKRKIIRYIIGLGSERVRIKIAENTYLHRLYKERYNNKASLG